jgi:hypothetical protein
VEVRNKLVLVYEVGGVAWWGDGCDRTFDDDDVRSGEKLMERDGMRVAARGTAREKWIRTQRNTS